MPASSSTTARAAELGLSRWLATVRVLLLRFGAVSTDSRDRQQCRFLKCAITVHHEVADRYRPAPQRSMAE